MSDLADLALTAYILAEAILSHYRATAIRINFVALL